MAGAAVQGMMIWKEPSGKQTGITGLAGATHQGMVFRKESTGNKGYWNGRSQTQGKVTRKESLGKWKMAGSHIGKRIQGLKTVCKDQ